MHTPTWFSSTVEIKTRQLEEAKNGGWVGFERERSEGRRKKPPPPANNQTETVLVFTAPHFLRYIELERLATGMDAGERLLRIDRMPSHGRNATHPLEAQFGLSHAEILDLIGNRFRLEAAVRGGVAELHLKRLLESMPDLCDVTHLDEDGQPDFSVCF